MSIVSGWSCKKLVEERGSDLKAIATHDGTFHVDEVIATGLLRRLPQYKDHIILRTRDEEIQKLCDVVVDTGNEFCVSKNRFDHHQSSFAETWDDDRTLTKLSSAGLVWKYYGKQLLSSGTFGPAKDVEKVWQRVYELIFESIDASDNGVKLCPCKPAYAGGLFSVRAEVARMNPDWNSSVDQTAAFVQAQSTLIQSLEQAIRFIAEDLDGIEDSFRQAERFPIGEANGKKLYAVVLTHPSKFLKHWYQYLINDDSVVAAVTDEGVEWQAVVLTPAGKLRRPYTLSIASGSSLDDVKRSLKVTVTDPVV